MNVVIWSRVSSITQDYTRQKNQLKKFAEDKGWTVLEEFEEKKSAYRSGVDRKEFDKMIEFVKTNNVQKILVTELSRISRSAIKIQNFVEEFKKIGVSVFINSDPPIETIAESKNPYERIGADLLFIILAQFCQLEAELISIRSVDGKKEKLKVRALHFGKIPYGYVTKNKQLVINDKEKEIVKEIFDLTYEGYGQRKIAEILNNRKVPTYSAKKNKLNKFNQKVVWTKSNIGNILSNQLYTGIQRFTFKKGNEIFENEIPQIIPENLFEDCKKVTSSRINQRKSNRRYNILLAEKIICGKCGRLYSSAQYTDKEGKIKDSHYQCLGKKNSYLRCSQSSISIDVLNLFVWSAFTLSVNLWKKFLEEEEKIFDIKAKLQEIEVLEKNIADLIDEKDSIGFLLRRKVYDENRASEELNKVDRKIRKLKREISNIKKTIDNFNNRKNLTEDEYVNNVILAQDFQTKKDAIDKYVDLIKIFECNSEESSFNGKEKMWGNDKLFYVEIFIFNRSTPLNFICTSRSKLFYLGLDGFRTFNLSNSIITEIS